MSEYSDGNFRIADPASGINRTFPFEGDTESFISTQEFIQDATAFTPLPLNSPAADKISYLIGESERRDIGGGLVQWTRTFARVPVPRDEYESFTYTFPGYGITWGTAYFLPWAGAPTLGTIPVVADPGRAPVTLKVVSRLRHEYFMVGANGAYANAAAIPILTAQRYVYGSGFGSNAGGDLPDRILWDVTNWTSPSITAYRALVTAGTEIVAEDSEVRRWKGNIYVRVTRYIKAH